MKTLLSLLFVVVSLIGIADAGYITYSEYLSPGKEIICGPGFDCGTVLQSKYAFIGPVPLSALGLLFYATVFVMSVLLFLEIEITPIFRVIADKFKLPPLNPLRFITVLEVIQILALSGALFSLYLVYLMGDVIQAWCQFCLISAGTSLTLFLLVAIYTNRIKPDSPFLLKTIAFEVMHFLYSKILKQLLFLVDPEKVHNGFTAAGSIMGRLSLTRILTSSVFSFNHKAAGKTIDGIDFPNPVGLSAGFDYNGDLTGILPDVGFGFHTIGTVTFEPYEGNPKPRLGRLKQSRGLIVNKGLKGLGAKAIIEKLEDEQFRIPTGISIASTNKLFESETEQITDILMSFQLFEESKVGHSYYELNISCPNTFGGEPFTTPKRLKILLTALDKLKVSKPIYVKMPIDQSEQETSKMLDVIAEHDIHGIIIGNLTKDKNNPAITSEDRKVWQAARGNISGKPNWERSNKLIKLAKKNFGNRLTIIGTGGIFSASDAQEKMKLGADLVQLITGMIYEGPQLIGQITHLKARKKLK